MIKTLKNIILFIPIISIFSLIIVSNLSVTVITLTPPAGPPLPPVDGGGTGGGATTSTTISPKASQICPGGTCPGGASKITLTTTREGILGIFIRIATWLTFVAAGVAILFMVIGGYYYITDNGAEERSVKGKKILINASIGLAVAILAYSIVFLINNLLSGGDLLSGILGTTW